MCNILGSSIEFVTIARYRVLRYFRCHGMLIYIIIMFAWNKYTDYSFFSFFLIITVGSACKIDCKLQNEKNLWSYYSMLPHAQIFGEFFSPFVRCFQKRISKNSYRQAIFHNQRFCFQVPANFFWLPKKGFQMFSVYSLSHTNRQAKKSHLNETPAKALFQTNGILLLHSCSLAMKMRKRVIFITIGTSWAHNFDKTKHLIQLSAVRYRVARTVLKAYSWFKRNKVDENKWLSLEPKEKWCFQSNNDTF